MANKPYLALLDLPLSLIQGTGLLFTAGGTSFYTSCIYGQVLVHSWVMLFILPKTQLPPAVRPKRITASMPNPLVVLVSHGSCECGLQNYADFMQQQHVPRLLLIFNASVYSGRKFYMIPPKLCSFSWSNGPIPPQTGWTARLFS